MKMNSVLFLLLCVNNERKFNLSLLPQKHTSANVDFGEWRMMKRSVNVDAAGAGNKFFFSQGLQIFRSEIVD